jgi:hypothetical protein
MSNFGPYYFQAGAYFAARSDLCTPDPLTFAVGSRCSTRSVPEYIEHQCDDPQNTSIQAAKLRTSVPSFGHYVVLLCLIAAVLQPPALWT